MLHSTKDIDEAAYVGCQPGVVFKGSAKSGRHIFFEFEGAVEMAALANEFYMKRGKVEPRAYSQWQRDLRDIVRKEKDNRVQL